MSVEILEKLEELVNALVLESQILKGENRRLAAKVQSLFDELSKLQSREAELDKEMALLDSLKSENKKMQYQKEQVTIRVRGILDNLDKMDFI
tara:strand:- start:2042 stop:2320 length:279 start_codon:yes stop_codon:yes gene_type:complete